MNFKRNTVSAVSVLTQINDSDIWQYGAWT